MYSASIDNRGDSKYHASTGAFGFVMDTDGQGVSPVGALLASLCACLGHYVRDFLGGQKLAYSFFAVRTSLLRTTPTVRRGPLRVRAFVLVR